MATEPFLTSDDRTYLRVFMDHRFSLEDLHILAFDLSLDWDYIPHSNKHEAIITLIEYHEHRETLACLIIQIVARRPDARLSSFLTLLPPCGGRDKIQIILPQASLLKPELYARITELMRLAPDDISVIGILPGSTRVLIGLPADVAQRLATSEPRILTEVNPRPFRLGADEAFRPTSITPYQELPRRQQRLWRATADLSLAYMFRNDGVLDAARAIEDPLHRAAALASLAAFLPERQRTEILRDELGILRPNENRFPDSILAPLFPYLPEQQQERLLQEALATADRSLEDAYSLSIFLTYLPPQRRESLLAEVLSRLVNADAQSPWLAAETLAIFAPQLPDPLLPPALEWANSLSSEQARFEAFAALAPYVPVSIRDQLIALALASAPSPSDPSALAEALVTLALRLPSSDREDVLSRAVVTTLSLPPGPQRTQLLADLVPYLTDPLRSAVLDNAIATAAPNDSSRIDQATALTALVPFVPGPDRQQVLGNTLNVVKKIQDEPQRASALAVLAPYLPEDLLADAYASTISIEDYDARLHARAALAPFLPASLLERAVQDLDSALHGLSVSEHAKSRAAGALLRIGTPKALSILEDYEYRTRQKGKRA